MRRTPWWVIAAIFAFAIASTYRYYNPEHHAPKPAHTTYPAYTEARCQHDILTWTWEWLDDNGNPILCGSPKGPAPQPASYTNPY